MSDQRIMNGAALDTIADAIEKAQCPDRQGPYGLFDYSRYPGDSPPRVVRDFRYPGLPTFGHQVFSSHHEDKAAAEFERLTRRHIAAAAVVAVLNALQDAGMHIVPLAAPEDAVIAGCQALDGRTAREALMAAMLSGRRHEVARTKMRLRWAAMLRHLANSPPPESVTAHAEPDGGSA